MRKLILFSVVSTLAIAFSLGSVFAAGQAINFAYLGKPDPHKAAYTTGVVNFAHLLEKGSGGRLKVKIFPAGTLGKETDIMQAVRSNAVQMTSASMVTLSRIFPPAQVMMAPYVFKNDAVAWEVVERGYRALVTSVDLSQRAVEFLGREFDADLVTEISCMDGVDPCGERGEYHTFVFDGPEFAHPVGFTKGQTFDEDGHRFLDLIPFNGHVAGSRGDVR